MAVLRSSQTPIPAAHPAPPAHLRHCYVEDWVNPDEEQPKWSLPAPWPEWAESAARSRWRTAVTAWMDEHQVPGERQCEVIPFQRARWRQQPPTGPL